MAKQPTITDLSTLADVISPINDNFDNIQSSFDNTLSRDGSTPNQMEADIDLNSNDLLNVGDVNADNLVVDGVNLNTKVAEAATSATNAATSETNAANSASAAATSEDNAAASAIEAAQYDPTTKYTDVAAFLASTTTYPDGTYVTTTKEGFSYKAVSSGADVINAGSQGFELQTQGEALLNVKQLGAYADGSSHPLSGRYSTLADAQAAFPLSHAEGYVTALTQEIDWACAQEASLIVKGHITKFSGVLLGAGIHKWSDAVTVVGNNSGFEFVGTPGFMQQQGSTEIGCQVDYTGAAATPILELDGTFRTVRNVNFQNFGGARSAIRFGSPTFVASGRGNLTSCSFVEGGGTTPYTTAIVEYLGPTDYSIIERCQFVGSTPIFISFDQDEVGGTTKLDIRDNVFQMTGSGNLRVIQVFDALFEQLTSENNAYIMEPGGGFMVGIDTGSVDAASFGGYIQLLRSINDEWDYQSANTNARFIEAENCERVVVQNPVLQNQGGQPTAMINLTNSNLSIQDGNFRSINGPVVHCTDSVSTVTNRGGHYFDSSNTQGLTDETLVGNIIGITQPSAGGTVTLQGVDSQLRNAQEVFYEMEITANSLVRMAARTHTDSPPGFWTQGQVVNFGFKNTSGVTWNSGNIDWAAGINGNASPGASNGETLWYKFVWTGTIFLQCADEVAVTH